MKRNTRIVGLFVASAVAVSSCQTLKNLRAPYESDNQVPENLFGNNSATSSLRQGTSLGNLSWRSLFNDSHLEALVDKALTSNTDMMLSRKRVEEMETSLSIARKAFLPSVVFSPQGSWSRYDADQLRTYNFPVTAQWQADIFGSIHNKKMLAKVMKEQAEDVVQATQCELIANVANLYYDLLMFDRQKEILSETEQIRFKEIDTQKALMEAGIVTSAAVDQMRASYYDVQAQKVNIDKNIVQTENALCLLLGDTPHPVVRGRISDFVYPSQISVGVPVSILANRPDIRSAERNIETAFYVTQSAKAELYPNLTLSGSVGWTNNGLAGLVDPGKILYNAVASLTQPIFAQGKLRGNVWLSEMQMEEARMSYVQTMLSAGKDVNDALVVCQSAEKRQEILARQVSALESAYNATKELMLHGQGTYLEVLTAQESLLAAKLEEVVNRYEAIQGLISLYIALGGGNQ